MARIEVGGLELDYELIGDETGVFGCMTLLGCEDACPKNLTLSTQIAFLRRSPGEDCRIMAVQASGGEPRVLGQCDPHNRPSFDWTPDGNGLVHLLSREDGALLNRLSTDGSAIVTAWLSEAAVLKLRGKAVRSSLPPSSKFWAHRSWTTAAKLGRQRTAWVGL